MTANEKLKEARKIISDIINENMDISDEKWYGMLLQSAGNLDTAIKLLEKQK